MDKYIDNKRVHLVVMTILVLLLFINNGNVSLWDQDEPAYAAFAYKMNETGNYLIPDFYWSAMHRKPPLHFWNIAASYKIFGVNEFAVRFPSALSIALLYLALYFFVRKISGDKRLPLYSVIVLATCLFIPFIAKVSVTDASLLLFSTLCAIAQYHILEKRSLFWLLVFWVCFALALLTKGPPIILFTGVFGLLILIFHPGRKGLLRLHPWFFLPLAAAPLIYWGWLCNKVDGGEFTRWMIDWYILKRVSGSVLGQTGPPGTHFVILTVVFLPYLLFFPGAIKAVFSGLRRKEKTDVFLAAWFIAGWLLYEFTPSKLPAYVVAAYVPLAILIARNMVNYNFEKKRGALAIVQFAIMSLIYVAFIVVPFIVPLPRGLSTVLPIAGVVMLLAITITFFVAKRKNFVPLLLGVNILFQVLVWGLLIQQVDVLKSAQKQVGIYVKEHATPGSKIVIGNHQAFPPSLPFYLYLNFKDIHLEGNEDQVGWLNIVHKEKVVFILNTQQRDHLLREQPELKFQKFVTNFTDRKDQSAYYVMVKK